MSYVEPLLHVVLYQPDIPQNTGNIGRTCVAVGAKLWLIRPLGFRVDAKSLKRAGMDYWPLLDWEAVESLDEVNQKLQCGQLAPRVDTPLAERADHILAGRRWWCLTKTAQRLVWEAAFQPGDVLLFGSETRGLPGHILQERPSQNLRLPMRPEVRSLNLASTVNTVVYEAVRQFGGLPGAT